MILEQEYEVRPRDEGGLNMGSESVALKGTPLMLNPKSEEWNGLNNSILQLVSFTS